MLTRIFPLKLSPLDCRLFGQAAKAEHKSVAEFLREAGRERARRVTKRFACLDYPDFKLSTKAEQDKSYVARVLKRKNGKTPERGQPKTQRACTGAEAAEILRRADALLTNVDRRQIAAGIEKARRRMNNEHLH